MHPLTNPKLISIHVHKMTWIAGLNTEPVSQPRAKDRRLQGPGICMSNSTSSNPVKGKASESMPHVGQAKSGAVKLLLNK